MLHRKAQKGLQVVLPVRLPLLVFLISLVLSGCQSLRPHTEIPFINGAIAESLSSNASVSFVSSGKSASGNGFFMYRKPDQMRMVVLSPFGSVLQEVYVSGEAVTIVDTGNGIAFSGSYRDLPEKGDLTAWRYVNWLIDVDPPDVTRGTAVVERVNKFGEPEKAHFENGMLISKSTAAAGFVHYDRYTAVQGVVFPLEIMYETSAKEKFIIRLEDPELNGSFADGAFTPNLSKLRVYPLSVLQ